MFNPTWTRRRIPGSVVQSIMNRGAFDAADLPQGSRQFVLARVRGELAQDLAGPHGPGGHGGRDAQDVRPVPVDQVDVHLAADQRAQELRDARAVEHVESLRRQVPDARDEGVAEDRARGEDVVGESARWPGRPGPDRPRAWRAAARRRRPSRRSPRGAGHRAEAGSSGSRPRPPSRSRRRCSKRIRGP